MKKTQAKARGKNDYQPPKPLWRFGWRGWTLLPIAIVLAVIFFTGYDLRTPLLTLIYELFGIDVVMWIVTTGMPFHAFDVVFTEYGFSLEPRFGLVTMCLVLIAMSVHPKRFPWWAYLSVLLLGVSLPPMLVQCSVSVYRAFGPGMPWGGWQTILSDVIARTSAIVVTAAVLWGLTRSRAVLVFVVITGLLTAWTHAQTLAIRARGGTLFGSPIVANLALLLRMTWNPALLGILLWWAIRARRQWKPPWACQSCGYDLRGTPDQPCPECGTPVAPKRISPS